MNISGRIKQGFYFDSVTIMRTGRELSGFPGVVEASVVMATEANKSILDMSGLLLPEFKKSDEQDLLIVVKAKDAKAANEALAKAEDTRKDFYAVEVWTGGRLVGRLGHEFLLG